MCRYILSSVTLSVYHRVMHLIQTLYLCDLNAKSNINLKVQLGCTPCEVSNYRLLYGS